MCQDRQAAHAGRGRRLGVMGRPIRLHVDELVLHGLPQIDATRVADALQRELRWRLAE